MNYFFFLFTIFSFSSFACEIQGPSRLIKSENASNLEIKNLLTFSKCNQNQINASTKLIKDFSGVLRNKILRSELSETSLIKPINIQNLEELVNQRVSLPKDWKLIGIRYAHGNVGAFALNEGDSLSIECLHCSNTGKKNLKGLITNPHQNTVKALWFNASLAVKTKSLIAKRNLTLNNKSLDPSDFKFITTFSENPSQLFTKREQLVFYKLNKGKSKGESISFNDITPVNLVSVGQPVTILLVNKGLVLEGKATPHQSGKLGQVIRLKNNRTNKTVIGKVVDFNKVEVQL